MNLWMRRKGEGWRDVSYQPPEFFGLLVDDDVTERPKKQNRKNEGDEQHVTHPLSEESNLHPILLENIPFLRE